MKRLFHNPAKQRVFRGGLGLAALLVVFAAPAAGEIVKVGVLAPLSGLRADGGAYLKNGLTLADKHIREDPRRRFKLKLIFEDTQYAPRLAVTAFHKLRDLEGVNYLIGTVGSSEALAVAPLAQRSATIFIAPFAMVDELTEAGDYIFRTNYPSAYEARLMAKFLVTQMRGNTLHMLVIQTAITAPYLSHLNPLLRKAGKVPGLIEEFTPEETDMRAQLLKIKAQNPADIFLIAMPIQAGYILKQAHELGIKAQFYNLGTEGFETAKIAGAAAEGLLYPYGYDAHSQEEPVQNFYRAYLEEFKHEPDAISANAYDAAFILSACLEKSGDEVNSVKSCLLQIKDYHGASGVFSMDMQGNAIKKLFIKTIKDGKLVKYGDS